MPIKTTQFVVKATLDWGDDTHGPEHDWEGQIELKINTIVLSPKQCQEIAGKLTEYLSANEARLASMSSTVSLVEWETKREAETVLFEKVANRLNALAGSEDEAPRLREALIEQEQAKSWPISGRELEITSEHLVLLGFDPISREDLKA
jgi:hypothetical protein